MSSCSLSGSDDLNDDILDRTSVGFCRYADPCSGLGWDFGISPPEILLKIQRRNSQILSNCLLIPVASINVIVLYYYPALLYASNHKESK